MPGPIRVSLFQLDEKNMPVQWQAVRRMVFSAMGQLWEIRFTAGSTTDRRDMSGG